MTTYEEFRFPAQLDEVIDGDTQDFTVDLGFHLRRKIRVRLAHLDTAEIYGTREDSEEHQTGDEQTEFVEQWLQTAAEEWDEDEWPLVIETNKDKGKFGRYVATITRRCDGDVLNSAIIEKWPDAEL